MKNVNKILVVALAVTMLALAAVSATLAYLYDTDTAVKNTFAVGKVYIELTDDVVNFEIVPADSADEKPYVTVLAGSEASYVFVKVDESLGSLQDKATELGKTFADYVTYSMDANDWTQLGTSNIWYTTVDESADATSIDLLTGDKISYPAGITNEMLLAAQTGDVAFENAITAGAEGTKPTLTFTAFAIQQLGFQDVDAAYDALQDAYSDLLPELN